MTIRIEWGTWAIDAPKKPRIKRYGKGSFRCNCSEAAYGVADTPANAFDRWFWIMTTFLLMSHQTRHRVFRLHSDQVWRVYGE